MNRFLLASCLFSQSICGAFAQSSLPAPKPISLEWKDVFNASVTEESVAGLCVVRIRGLSGHSAMGVDHTSIRREEQAMWVYVEVAPARHGTPGTMDLAPVLDKTVQRVEFGKDRAVIWRKDTSKCVFK
jgi:hypothetical protein